MLITPPSVVTNSNTTEMGFTSDSVSANSRDYRRFKHYRPKTHPQTSSTRLTSSTRRKTATPVIPATICEHEVGDSSRYAVAQAPTIPSPPTRALKGIVQDLKKRLSFKASTKKERIAGDLAPEQAPTSRPPERNGRLSSGTRPLSETKQPSRTKPPSGNRPHSGKRMPSGSKPHSRKRAQSGSRPHSRNMVQSGNKLSSRTRLSSGKKPPSGTGRPPEAKLPSRTRPSQRVREGEPEDEDIKDGITTLYELIRQHAEQFHESGNIDYARRKIGETFGG